MMNNILNKLSTFSPLPKTRCEKFLHWYRNNLNLCFTITGITTILSSFLFFPITKYYLVPIGLDLDTMGNVLLHGLSTTPMVVIFCFTYIRLSSLSDQSSAKLKNDYKKEVLNYLKDYAKDNEIKEFLQKIKWVSLYNEITQTEAELTPYAKDYLALLDQDEFDNESLIQARDLIVGKLTQFLNDNMKLFQYSVDELKALFRKDLAQKLKKEREEAKQVNCFIDDFANEDESLFQNNKTLKTHL